MKKAILLLLVVLFPWGASYLFHRMGFQFDAIGEKLLWSSRELRRTVWADLTPPADWRDDHYLALNPDVAARVREGLFFNGYEHYLKHGKTEGRRGGFPDPKPPAVEVAQTPPPPPTPPQPASSPPQAAPPPPASPPPAPGATAPVKPAPEPTPPVPAPSVQPAAAAPPAPRLPIPEPPALGGQYIVRNGGGLAKVAEVTGIPVAELKAANPDLPGWLPPGTVVRLPEGRPAAEPPPALAPVVTAPPPPPPAPVTKPAAAPAIPSIAAVRFGQHGEQVRVVLDTSAPVNFRYTVQSDRKTIVIDLPGTGWNAARAWKAGEGALFNSFQADTGVSGSRLVLRAGRDVEVKQAALFPPAGERGHRIVMDVSAAKGAASR